MNDQMTRDRSKFASKFVDVHGARMHYLEAGQGSPILFLHGVPTSSYVWRNIIPHLSTLGRCIAPDLIGFGKSDRPDIAYSIHDHIKYVEGFINALGLKKVILVMHGWGSVIGSHYAMSNEGNCRGLVFYEAFLRAMVDENISLPFEEQLAGFEEQELAVASEVVDTMLSQSTMSQLSQNDMACYREPFSSPDSGKPIFQYLKELPRGDGKSEVDKIIAKYTAKLEKSLLPKLMLYSMPGFVTTIATAMWAKEHLPKLEMIDIGEELHLGQESCPDLIGEAISVWLQSLAS